MSKQLHTVFIIPAAQKLQLLPIEDRHSKQHLQEMMAALKTYWQEASGDLLQPRNEVMEKLFRKVLH